MVGSSDPLESREADLQHLVGDAVLATTVPGSLLITAVRNESPFLLEWIAYHKAIGFERVVIFSNDSDDGTEELLAAIAERGEIEHIPHKVPDSVSPQENAALIAQDRGFFSTGEWVIWLDADEFLVVNVGEGRLSDLVGAIGVCEGLLIPWRIFGDGGNTHFPGRFVSQSFVLASDPNYKENYHIKTLFRPRQDFVRFCRPGLHRPLYGKLSGLEIKDFVCANGHPISDSETNRNWISGNGWSESSQISSLEHGYKLAQINHYNVRTPEHFQLKRARGRGWIAGQVGETNRRHTVTFYDRMNRNDVEDRRILRFEAAVTAGIERLLSHPPVLQAERAARALVESKLSMLSLQSDDQVVKQDAANAEATPPGPARAAAIASPDVLPDRNPTAILNAHRFKPDFLVDVGVHTGTPYLYNAFPRHKFVLVDPIVEAERRVRQKWKKLQFDFHGVALGDSTGEVELNVPTMKWGEAGAMASVLERTDVLTKQILSVERRVVPLRRLDSLLDPYAGRFGLKIDTEGFELPILMGAEAVLDLCDFVILELSTSPRFEGVAPPSRVFEFLRRFGFELRDIVGLSQPTAGDRRLRHMDALFSRWI